METLFVIGMMVIVVLIFVPLIITGGERENYQRPTVGRNQFGGGCSSPVCAPTRQSNLTGWQPQQQEQWGMGNEETAYPTQEQQEAWERSYHARVTDQEVRPMREGNLADTYHPRQEPIPVEVPGIRVEPDSVFAPRERR